MHPDMPVFISIICLLISAVCFLYAALNSEKDTRLGMVGIIVLLCGLTVSLIN